MQRQESRSTSMDRPTQPSIRCSAGSTSSRMCAIPGSIDSRFAWTVVERAYTITIPIRFRGGARLTPPVAVHAPPVGDAGQEKAEGLRDRGAPRPRQNRRPRRSVAVGDGAEVQGPIASILLLLTGRLVELLAGEGAAALTALTAASQG